MDKLNPIYKKIYIIYYIQHHPNGAYAHLDPKSFNQNMTTQQIQKLMGLRQAPQYRTDEKGYIEFQPGLFIRNNFVVLDTLGRGIIYIFIYLRKFALN